MGLFSNNKKPCPICGNATPRLLPTKVEGVPICKECDKKIDLPNGVLDSMTLDDFRRYIDFYNKNQVLRERFHPEYRFGFGAFNTQLVLDVTNGLFRLKDDESTIVFEKSALKSFRITEDKEPALYRHGRRSCLRREQKPRARPSARTAHRAVQAAEKRL